ncbi:hypothetical protein CLU79DRAFT_766950 [Phycomyces nitens]|nr:hypothetical protein CLU79DRAFT_766950 [Phycomyces nitens]
MINIYHFLTDMSINLEESTLEIDQVLDNCLALKRLKISVLIFSKSFGQPIRPHPHGLRILYIYRSKITTDALGYLSLRCKLLNYMRLDTTEIIGAVSPATGDMRINMTHTCFKALCLYNVVFTTSQCARPNDSRVELVVLSWSKSKNRTKRTKDFSCLDSRANLKAKDLERNWFFLPCAKSKNKPKGGNFVCRLSKRKCDQVSKYFHRFKHTHDFSYMASVSCYSSFIDPSLERFWKANFFRGYVSFECGHVADYVFNNSGVCNEEYWQDLRCNI